MSESAEDIQEHVRVYVTVFVALACLTVVTVGISYIGMRPALAISVAMVVATVKACHELLLQLAQLSLGEKLEVCRRVSVGRPDASGELVN